MAAEGKDSFAGPIRDGVGTSVGFGHLCLDGGGRERQQRSGSTKNVFNITTQFLPKEQHSPLQIFVMSIVTSRVDPKLNRQTGCRHRKRLKPWTAAYLSRRTDEQLPGIRTGARNLDRCGAARQESFIVDLYRTFGLKTFKAEARLEIPL